MSPAHESFLVAQAGTALGAAASENLAAIAGSHSLTEAVHLGALALLGLIGTEHCMTPPFCKNPAADRSCRTYSTAGGKHSPTAAVDIRQALKLAHLSLYMSFFRLSTKI